MLVPQILTPAAERRHVHSHPKETMGMRGIAVLVDKLVLGHRQGT